jgi:predicted acetylornithine/succinylornithine family transaminase
MTLMGNYRREPVTFVRGRGAWLQDDRGEQYLDLVAGISVNALGHAHPRIVDAIAGQAAKLVHCSNLYFNEPQSALAERICKLSGMTSAFFCNSGSEAVEAAIKLARKHFWRCGDLRRTTVLYADGSFHGRTLGALALTDNVKYREGFGELPVGFGRIGFNNAGDLARIRDDVAAVFVEPVQGESGVREADAEWLRAVRFRCDHVGALLVLDEIQCGLGRTGELFATKRTGVVPDAIVLAKALGGGLPLGALLGGERVAHAFHPGDHGSTFGGNPVACAAGLAFLDVLEADRLAARVRAAEKEFATGLRAIAAKQPQLFADVRCVGFMAAVDVRAPFRADDLVGACLAHRVLITTSGGNSIRLLPPLSITDSELGEGLNRLALAACDLATRESAAATENRAREFPAV